MLASRKKSYPIDLPAASYGSAFCLVPQSPQVQMVQMEGSTFPPSTPPKGTDFLRNDPSKAAVTTADAAAAMQAVRTSCEDVLLLIRKGKPVYSYVF